MQKLLESVNCNIIDTIDNKLVNENLFGMSVNLINHIDINYAGAEKFIKYFEDNKLPIDMYYPTTIQFSNNELDGIYSPKVSFDNRINGFVIIKVLNYGIDSKGSIAHIISVIKCDKKLYIFDPYSALSDNYGVNNTIKMIKKMFGNDYIYNYIGFGNDYGKGHGWCLIYICYIFDLYTKLYRKKIISNTEIDINYLINTVKKINKLEWTEMLRNFMIFMPKSIFYRKE